MGDQRNWVGVPPGDEEKPPAANPLIVKLKVKKADHVCKICNKVFSCGKALGGHMRVHNSEGEGRRQHAPGHSSMKPAKANNGDPINGNNTTCQLCGKVFPSMKSLFGHMRCHPEREWRGINPPPPPPQPSAKNSSSSTLSDSAAGQSDSATTAERLGAKEDGPFKNWPVTARRGRKILAKQKSEKMHDPMPEAVQTLLLLARGDDREDEKEEGEEEKPYTTVSGGKSDEYSSDGYELADMYQSEEESDTKISSYMKQLGYKIEMNKKKKKTRKRKLRALEAVTAGGGGRASGRYRCSTCNKAFHTHQALGGHRASHKKYKSHSPTAWVEEEEEVDDEEEEDGEEEPSGEGVGTAGEESMESDEATPTHKCEICNKAFPSGQALGGHKRCHWVGPGDAALCSRISQEDAAAEAGPRVMDFDLNELPPAEGGEDVGFHAAEG